MNAPAPTLPAWKPTLYAAAGVFVVALVVRLWTLHAMEQANPLFATEYLDERMYLEMARGERPPGPWFVAPLYPAMLELLGATTRHSAAVVNCVIGSLVAVLATIGGAHLGRSLVGGLTAGGIVALAGPFVFLDTTVASEPLTALLTLLGVLALCRATTTPGARTCLGAGLVLGLGALTRANALAAGLGLLAVLAATRRRAAGADDGSPRDASWMLKAGAFVGGVGALLILGSVWSVQSGGPFQPFPWAGGLNLHLSNGAWSREHFVKADPRIANDPHGEEMTGWQVAEQIANRKLDASGVGRVWTRVAIKDAVENPGPVFVHGLKKAVASFSHDAIGGNHDATVEGEFAPWTRWTPVTAWWILALGVGGLVLARRAVPSVDVAGLACAGHLLTLVVVFPLARYRLPIVPVAAVLAGAGVGALLHGGLDLRRRLQGSTAVVVVTLLAFAPLDLPSHGESYANIGERLRELKLPGAEVWFQRALDEDPRNAVASLRLGFSALEERRNSDALQHYSVAEGDLRTRAEALIGLARALSNLGRHDDALRANARLQQLTPSDANAVAEGALLALMAGRRDDARVRLARARALDPQAEGVLDVARRLGAE